MTDKNEVIVAYKGFDQELKCRGYQYEIGGRARMKFSFSAALIAASRKISGLFPRVTAVGGDDLTAVKNRCHESYRRWGHCECPYPVGDIRRSVWIDETQKIVRERLGTAFRDPGAVIRLIAGGGEVVPFPAPVPAPEEQEPQKEAARLVRWNGEDVYV